MCRWYAPAFPPVETGAMVPVRSLVSVTTKDSQPLKSPSRYEIEAALSATAATSAKSGQDETIAAKRSRSVGSSSTIRMRIVGTEWTLCVVASCASWWSVAGEAYAIPRAPANPRVHSVV